MNSRLFCLNHIQASQIRRSLSLFKLNANTIQVCVYSSARRYNLIYSKPPRVQATPTNWPCVTTRAAFSISATARLNHMLSKSTALRAFLLLATPSLTQTRTKLKGGPGYTNFGHGRPIIRISKFGYFWLGLLTVTMLAVTTIDFTKLYFSYLEPSRKLKEASMLFSDPHSPKAKEIAKSDDDERNAPVNEDNNELSETKESEKKKSKMSFRENKLIQYENRIRQYSTPDKVFRYFATVKVWSEKINDYEVYMTPEDFVRSLTYGAKQPEGLGLDSYNKFDPKMQKLSFVLPEDSIFKFLGQEGLISFSDFIFLVTLLSTPVRHFEIAFHMFDLDGNGNIDHQEFEQLNSIIRNQTSLGKRHRDTYMTGSIIKENFTLTEYFFGKDRSQLLTCQKFTDFQRKLQAEVIKMEFGFCKTYKRESDGLDVISEESFCEMILAYANFKSDKMKKMMKHIRKIYSGENSKGITFKDYEDFFQVLRSIQDIDTALKFYSVAGASIDKSILKHVSKTVANVDLSDNVVEVVFNLFDIDGDGKLSHREFINVMKKRWLRGLQMPKDTGFIKLLTALGTCSTEMILP